MPLTLNLDPTTLGGTAPLPQLTEYLCGLSTETPVAIGRIAQFSLSNAQLRSRKTFELFENGPPIPAQRQGAAVNGQANAEATEPVPSGNLKITVPKRKYSMYRNDSLLYMPTPTFDPNEVKKGLKTGPSSRNTVVTMAGLFVVGLTLLLSGFIVLIQHRELPFIITGCTFIGVALFMLIIVVILQRKNWVRLAHQLDQDLYFLNISNNPMWKLMFDETDTDLNASSLYRQR